MHDRVGMSCESRDLLPGVRVPQLDRPIKAGRSQVLAVGAIGLTVDLGRVPPEREQAARRLALEVAPFPVTEMLRALVQEAMGQRDVVLLKRFECSDVLAVEQHPLDALQGLLLVTKSLLFLSSGYGF